MDTPHPAPAAERLRGLDPERLLGLLDDDLSASLPVIPGWRVLGVAGQGGSGIVWRAERESDGVMAAIKIAPPYEPETVERIEREAAFLRDLRHSNIVRLLDAGPLCEGDDEGGLYMAMEFIDGPALVQEIPENGLPPQKAYRWFREIAAGVAHAHDVGVLHRDLKPANVLITTDGHVKVADFGLARPVHRRVHMLSLTRAGLVAGTAEYLPPEAYRRDYQPGPAADIFALGVMLHEMLTGTPPRGAWQPASSRKGVDVRVDEIIHRAIHPDPAARWPDARAMVKALDSVLASLPRYAGTPLITFPIRVTDCLWTHLGIFLFLAGTSSLFTLDNAWVSLPFDLIGDHGRLIGSFHALFVLTTLAAPLGIWQIVRLRLFRHIPMREALPSPFGLRLGSGRTAAFLVFLCQVICLLIPVLHMLILFGESSLTWLHSGDPPWAHGLAVTTFHERIPLDPWSLPDPGKTYWLWESDGPPDNPLCKTIERISFVPFIVPLLMLVGGVLAVGALWMSAITAFRTWWSRRRRVIAVLSLISLAGLTAALGKAYSHQSDHALEMRKPDSEDPSVPDYMTRHLKIFAENLLVSNPGKPVFGTHGEQLEYYAEAVDYRGHGMVPRARIPVIHSSGSSPARLLRIEILDCFQSWKPKSNRFDVKARGLEFLDDQVNGGGSGANLLQLHLAGEASINGHTAIHHEHLHRELLWQADEIVIQPHEAVEWAQSLKFTAEAVARDDKSAPELLEPLFHPVSAEPDAYHAPREWYQPTVGHAGGVIRSIMDGTLELQPAGTVLERTLPGGRSLISIPVQEGVRRKIYANLIRAGGNWRCVKLAF